MPTHESLEEEWEGWSLQRLREGLMRHSKRCADDHRGGLKDTADGLSAPTAMLVYTALVTKAGAWRQSKINKWISELGPATHLSSVTY